MDITFNGDNGKCFEALFASFCILFCSDARGVKAFSSPRLNDAKFTCSWLKYESMELSVDCYI